LYAGRGGGEPARHQRTGGTAGRVRATWESAGDTPQCGCGRDLPAERPPAIVGSVRGSPCWPRTHQGPALASRCL